MSASSKKKLRKEQVAAKMTEQQLTEQKEAKKLKLMTISFIVVLALVIVSAIVVLSLRAYTNSGIREKNTVALTIGDQELTAADFNYYFYDAINNFYAPLQQQYGNSATGIAAIMYGIDLSAPLDDQVYNSTTGETWADYFVQNALTSVSSNYAIYNEAVKNGFTLTDSQKASLESEIKLLPTYASAYGYGDAEAYLDAMYSHGAEVESYENYRTIATIASAYATEYYNNLSFTEEEIEKQDKADPKSYNTYSYAGYYLAASSYKDIEGDEAKLAAAKADADTVLKAATSLDAMDKAIGALKINAGLETPRTSTQYNDEAYGNVISLFKDWVTADERKSGDATIIESYSDADKDGNKTLLGYYVVYHMETKDNDYPLANVRHILVAFDGGTMDSNGNVTYSAAEKATAMATAEKMLRDWKAGEATEESFAALAKLNTDDTASKENGGLYEDVYPGQMVTNFNDWCFDDARTAGDTGVVESVHGYHVMYYVGDSETTYREYAISIDLKNEAINTWQTDLVKNTTVVENDLSLVERDVIYSSGY